MIDIKKIAEDYFLSYLFFISFILNYMTIYYFRVKIYLCINKQLASYVKYA